jgi:hypothetical protein
MDRHTGTIEDRSRMTEPTSNDVPDGDATSPGDVLAGARIDTETMPDGRSIHYYTWPDPEPVIADKPVPGDV